MGGDQARAREEAPVLYWQKNPHLRAYLIKAVKGRGKRQVDFWLVPHARHTFPF
jgi:hypothetical protein